MEDLLHGMPAKTAYCITPWQKNDDPPRGAYIFVTTVDDDVI
jgi:hypothetical protein